MAKQKPNLQIETRDDYKRTVESVMQQAHHSIDIFTQDLEPEILNHKEIEQYIIRLAKRHADTAIRILVKDSMSAAQHGHCLIRLAQTLSSSVFIHALSGKYREEQCGFVLADKTAFIHRVSAHDRNYHAVANLHAPHEATKLLHFFNEAWEHSTPDIQARRLYV